MKKDRLGTTPAIYTWYTGNNKPQKRSEGKSVKEPLLKVLNECYEHEKHVFPPK